VTLNRILLAIGVIIGCGLIALAIAWGSTSTTPSNTRTLNVLHPVKAGAPDERVYCWGVNFAPGGLGALVSRAEARDEGALFELGIATTAAPSAIAPQMLYIDHEVVSPHPNKGGINAKVRAILATPAGRCSSV
jgi:hypothetical protein